MTIEFHYAIGIIPQAAILQPLLRQLHLLWPPIRFPQAGTPHHDQGCGSVKHNKKRLFGWEAMVNRLKTKLKYIKAFVL